METKRTLARMAAQTASLVLVLALVSGQAQSSAVKGHSSGPQRAVEQAPIKSPQQQLAERQPKAAAFAQPILESSRKVYNDESIRRSAASSQQQVASEPSAKSAAAPVVVEPALVPATPVVAVVPQSAPVVVVPVAPVVPMVRPVEPMAVASAPAPVAVAPKEQPVAVMEAKKAPELAAVEPKSDAKPVEAVVPVAVKQEAADKDELPAQSVRSAPVKDEQPIAPVASKVIVEQVVPAKVAVPEQAAPAPVVVSVIEPVKPTVEQPVESAKPVAVVQDSPLQAKKDEQPKEAEPAPIEVPAPDPGLVLSEPIDSTTKLLIDLDEHVQKFLPAEDKQEPVAPAKDQVLVNGVDYSPAASGAEQPSGKSNVPLVPYSSSSVNEPEPIVPPLPQAIDKVEKASASGVASAAAASGPVQSNTRQASSHQNQNQQQVITQLLDQLDSLQNRIQDTINQLVARRRYVMSALLRPMGTYVRRVRTNLERLQNRVNQLQAAAVSVGGNQNGQRPGGFVDAAAIETIRRRIDDISKRISDIVNRIRFSLTPTSAPLNSNGK